MFTNAIVKTPAKSIVKGISTADLGIPIYEKALEQHQNYIEALEASGVEVKVIEADENFPDSTFIEDVALCTNACAIITNPGAASRKGEVGGMEEILSKFYFNIEKVSDPGTVEAGDIMMVGDHFYIGLSERTNDAGASQMIDILDQYGYSGSKVDMSEMLHLKTGLAYLENNNLLACGEFLTKHEFKDFNLVEIDKDESYAANSIWVNGNVLVPKGFPKTKNKIKQLGYDVLEVDVSEFRKLDGGLSCLSLRF